VEHYRLIAEIISFSLLVSRPRFSVSYNILTPGRQNLLHWTLIAVFLADFMSKMRCSAIWS